MAKMKALLVWVTTSEGVGFLWSFQLHYQQVLVAWQALVDYSPVGKSISEAAAGPFIVKSNSNNLWLMLSPLLLPQVDNPTGKTPTTPHRLQPSSFRLTGGWRKITSKGKGWEKNETKIRRDAT